MQKSDKNGEKSCFGRIRLVTAASREYAPLVEVTGPGKREYAARWGLECVEAEHWEPVDCWQRPAIWLRELALCDWLWFTGADVMITNHGVDVRDLIEPGMDMIFAIDGNGLQSDVMLLRHCPAVVSLLERVIGHRGRAENEQDALNIELSGARDYGEYCQRVGDLRTGGEPPGPGLMAHCERELSRSDVRVRILPQRRMNAYPHLLYGGTGHEAHSWQPGDFIAHTPGIPNSVRIPAMAALPVAGRPVL